MSRQIQIRRGTVAQHETFTGAVGELTFDGQTLRVHDGVTPGGIILARADEITTSTPIPDNADYVIEMQSPTSDNNYTWYRKYASGWVEQGGHATSSASKPVQVTLPIEMSDGNYTISLTTSGYGSPNYDPCVINLRQSASPTKTGFTIQTKNHSSQMFSSPFIWEVKGMSKQ